MFSAEQIEMLNQLGTELKFRFGLDVGNEVIAEIILKYLFEEKQLQPEEVTRAEVIDAVVMLTRCGRIAVPPGFQRPERAVESVRRASSGGFIVTDLRGEEHIILVTKDDIDRMSGEEMRVKLEDPVFAAAVDLLYENTFQTVGAEDPATLRRK